MNIKSLLLGSAAGMVAVSGAQAADAIVYAEPEPVEYVRVCDVYGSGFFYIPGTETCLRVGGEMRYQIGASSLSDTWAKQSRFRLFVDARSDTELGTLRAYLRYDARRDSGANVYDRAGLIGFAGETPTNDFTNTNKAFLELGGLKMGFEDSAWHFTPNAGAANYGSHSDTGLAYGYQQRNLVQYNFTGANGFFGTVSLEDDNHDGSDYMPDVVGKVGINQGWGAVWGVVGYDDDVYGMIGDDSGWAAQLGVAVNVPNAPGSSLRLLGFYADSDNVFNGHGGEWSVIGSYMHQFTPAFGASVGVQYTSDLYLAGTDISTNRDAWAAELNVVWTPVQDFAVRTEITYTDIDQLGGGSTDATSGWVRFSRFF